MPTTVHECGGEWPHVGVGGQVRLRSSRTKNVAAQNLSMWNGEDVNTQLTGHSGMCFPLRHSARQSRRLHPRVAIHRTHRVREQLTLYTQARQREHTTHAMLVAQLQVVFLNRDSSGVFHNHQVHRAKWHLQFGALLPRHIRSRKRISMLKYRRHRY